MALLDDDKAFLELLGCKYDVVEQAGISHLILHEYRLPKHYEPQAVDLLIRLLPTYPDTAPDMWYTRPDVRLAGGGPPLAVTTGHDFVSLLWQQWSRHTPPGTWRPGLDRLRQFFAMMNAELARGL